MKDWRRENMAEGCGEEGGEYSLKHELMQNSRSVCGKPYMTV